uniref:Glycosyltransferase 61 catalytic domain-containing protein n=1 Tax=Leersia perrieri TaxID=77586 RepID=A0A0D9WTY1_9ORYZ
MKAAVRSKKSRGSFCHPPLLLLIVAIQFLVIYSPTLDQYMMMLTTGKPGFPSMLIDGRRSFKQVDEFIPEPHLRCDFRDNRSDVCEMEGAIRILGRTSEVFLVAPSLAALAAGAGAGGVNATGVDSNATSWKIQPYTRKGESRVMPGITEVTVRLVTAGEAPPCDEWHDSSTPTAIVYSNGGYCGNYYHDFNDNIIPLFITSRHLAGEAHLLVTQKQRWWFGKYKEIVAGLTNYDPIDLDADDRVRCYRRAIVGLHSHKDLSIDPRRSPNNNSMVDFKRFLMWRYNLPREHAIRMDDEPTKKPRLLVINRKSRRRFVNLDEIMAMAESVGFEVTSTELSPNMAEASATVNSFDVMVAVHGSGLTNLVFLPMNAVVIQVVPLGRMEGLAMDEYGVPPKDMNMRYIQYNITAEESTLSEVYPRAHPVFLDPLPIHKQSWSLVKDIYLGKQDVRLDVRRFRPVLLKALDLLR